MAWSRQKNQSIPPEAPGYNEFLSLIALLTALLLSSVAAFYSIIGLTAIFAAAFWPVVIMGGSLELAKVVATSWLYRNWHTTPKVVKYYMTSAVVLLCLITSMGIFGFLSKAHSDLGVTSSEVISRISVYDEKIRTLKENIDANRKALKQLDDAVDQIMGRSSDEKGADKAVALRRSQQKERARLQAEIQADQKTISQLNEERAPIAAEIRKVEAEVGPIKYIANFVYGETEAANLDKAVTWVIILIILVFDPMALAMLIAANSSIANKQQIPEIQIPLKKKRKSDTIEIGANSIMRME